MNRTIVSPETSSDLPEPALKAGRYLLHLLRIENTERKTPIAGLSVEEALFRLKDQFRAFLKGVYPFNISVQPSDGSIEWWERLCTNNDAAPLAV